MFHNNHGERLYNDLKNVVTQHLESQVSQSWSVCVHNVSEVTIYRFTVVLYSNNIVLWILFSEQNVQGWRVSWSDGIESMTQQ
jgi:hypothetical protein